MLSHVGHDYLEFARGRFYIASYAAQLSQRIFPLVIVAHKQLEKVIDGAGYLESRPDNQSSRRFRMTGKRPPAQKLPIACKPLVVFD